MRFFQLYAEVIIWFAEYLWIGYLIFFGLQLLLSYSKEAPWFLKGVLFLPVLIHCHFFHYLAEQEPLRIGCVRQGETMREAYSYVRGVGGIMLMGIVSGWLLARLLRYAAKQPPRRKCYQMALFTGGILLIGIWAALSGQGAYVAAPLSFPILLAVLSGFALIGCYSETPQPEAVKPKKINWFGVLE